MDLCAPSAHFKPPENLDASGQRGADLYRDGMVAGDVVVRVADLLADRLDLAADVGRPRAPRMEPAAAGGIGRRRQLVADVPLAHVHGRRRLGNGGQQRPGVGMGGVGVDLGGAADLAHLAQVHDHDPVADVLHHRQVMGDEQHGQAVAALHVLQQVQDLGLDGHVQRRHRLIADQHLGIERQRPGDADALALAAGELVRAPGPVLRLHPDRVHQLVYAVTAPRPDVVTPHGQALGYHVADPAAGVERGDRVLEDHLQVGPNPAKVLTLEAGEILTGVDHLTRGDVDQADDGSGDGRLAAAGLTHDPEGLALNDVEAHLRHGVHDTLAARGKVHHEILDPQQHVVAVPQLGVARPGHQPPPPPLSVTGSPAAVTPAARLAAMAATPRSVPVGCRQAKRCSPTSPLNSGTPPRQSAWA